ncbi:MAG: UTP--glucose-1-phosphate uridylyltransferase [Lentisphaeria bacterium]|nr:UTP--glucose-1-phosphate uridylyltransferase [Lentisphaeria bacterium]
MTEMLELHKAKMHADGLAAAVVDCFAHYYTKLAGGDRGLVPNREITALDSNAMPVLDDLPPGDPAALAHTVMLKLNGGLGTSMGLKKAKSLLPVKPDFTFLDSIAHQAQNWRIRLLFMNSYNTRDDTRNFFDAYPQLVADNNPLGFLQNRFPRIARKTGEPLDFGDERDWNPPGHGDLYLAIQKDGLLDSLLAEGYRHLFVSNADNLGATPDPRIPAFMERNGVSFVLEACRRSAMDTKGGHLAFSKKRGVLLLREVAQCPDEDLDGFQDIDRFQWFNTNNLWIDLRTLKQRLLENSGFLPLPMIRNRKTVEGIDVVQIETAMGAAIELFPAACAMIVPRSRFVPVKKTDDLLVLRSDIYDLDPTTGVLSADAAPPSVALDEHFYKTMDDFDARFPAGAPSLKRCTELTVEGDVTFGSDVALSGAVHVTAAAPATLATGEYTGTITL